jgi:hypothetical protein
VTMMLLAPQVQGFRHADEARRAVYLYEAFASKEISDMSKKKRPEVHLRGANRFYTICGEKLISTDNEPLDKWIRETNPCDLCLEFLENDVAHYFGYDIYDERCLLGPRKESLCGKEQGPGVADLESWLEDNVYSRCPACWQKLSEVADRLSEEAIEIAEDDNEEAKAAYEEWEKRMAGETQQ